MRRYNDRRTAYHPKPTTYVEKFEGMQDTRLIPNHEIRLIIAEEDRAGLGVIETSAIPETLLNDPSPEAQVVVSALLKLSLDIA